MECRGSFGTSSKEGEERDGNVPKGTWSSCSMRMNYFLNGFEQFHLL